MQFLELITLSIYRTLLVHWIKCTKSDWGHSTNHQRTVPTYNWKLLELLVPHVWQLGWFSVC